MQAADAPTVHPSAKVIGWGIVGCGDVTEVKSGPALQLARGSRLVAVMRRDAAKAADYARRHGVPRWYDQVEALIADREVDAVYIATPPGSHLEIARRVAAAGKPAYVEKPMARNASECAAMLAAFQAAGQPLFVAYYRRALPRFRQIREWLAAGTIGTLTSVRCSFQTPAHRKLDLANAWRVEASHSGGGLFLDLGSHALDLLDFLVGPLVGMSGHAANRATPLPVEDCVALSFKTAGGAPGIACWNFASFVQEDILEFLGSEGRIVCSVFGNEPVRLENANGPTLADLPNPAHVQQPLIQTVVDALLGTGRCPSDGDSALRTSQAMDLVLADYYGGRDDAFWERPQTWPGRPVQVD
jgi:1,5-anhydro-D-fructose reductase (1,5-anhydro-D-mannitol-forming)